MRYYDVFSTLLPLCFPSRYPLKHFSSTGLTAHIDRRNHFSPIEWHSKTCQLVEWWMFWVWNGINEYFAWRLAGWLKICTCILFLRWSRNNWWDRWHLVRPYWWAVSVECVSHDCEKGCISHDLRPTCWSKANNFVVWSFETVEIDFQSVCCNRWQGYKMDNGIHGVWGQQSVQVGVTLTPQYGWFSSVAVHFSV